MNIVCLDGYTLNPGDNPWTPVEALGRLTVFPRTPPGQILERAAEAEVILTNKTVLTRERLQQLPRLQLISVLATGCNVVDVAIRKAHFPVAVAGNVDKLPPRRFLPHVIGWNRTSSRI